LPTVALVMLRGVMHHVLDGHVVTEVRIPADRVMHSALELFLARPGEGARMRLSVTVSMTRSIPLCPNSLAPPSEPRKLTKVEGWCGGIEGRGEAPRVALRQNREAADQPQKHSHHQVAEQHVEQQLVLRAPVDRA